MKMKLISLALLSVAAAFPAGAQETYPKRPVTLIVAQAPGGTEQFAALIASDLPKWARIVKESGTTVD